MTKVLPQIKRHVSTGECVGCFALEGRIHDDNCPEAARVVGLITSTPAQVGCVPPGTVVVMDPVPRTIYWVGRPTDLTPPSDERHDAAHQAGPSLSAIAEAMRSHDLQTSLSRQYMALIGGDPKVSVHQSIDPKVSRHQAILDTYPMRQVEPRIMPMPPMPYRVDAVREEQQALRAEIAQLRSVNAAAAAAHRRNIEFLKEQRNIAWDQRDAARADLVAVNQLLTAAVVDRDQAERELAAVLVELDGARAEVQRLRRGAAAPTALAADPAATMARAIGVTVAGWRPVV